MFCTKCGSKLEDDWIICPNCRKKINEEVENTVTEITKAEDDSNKKIEICKPSIWDKLEYRLSPILFLLIRFNGRVEGLDGHDKFMFWFRSIAYILVGFVMFYGSAGDNFEYNCLATGIMLMIGGILISPLLVFRLEPSSRTRRMFTGAFAIFVGWIVFFLLNSKLLF